MFKAYARTQEDLLAQKLRLAKDLCILHPQAISVNRLINAFMYGAPTTKTCCYTPPTKKYRKRISRMSFTEVRDAIIRMELAFPRPSELYRLREKLSLLRRRDLNNMYVECCREIDWRRGYKIK